MKTHHGDKIATILSQHIGREQAITAPAIALELGWPESRERLVRQLIAAESPLWPVLVCGVPGSGYFIAEDIEEAEKYANWLSDLARDAAAKVTSFRESARRMGICFPTPASTADAPLAAA